MSPRRHGRSTWLAPLAVAFVVQATRWPFLDAGLGIDPDSWRAYFAAFNFATTGEYLPSRRPGYPLPELVFSLMHFLRLADTTYLTTLTSIMSGAAAFFYYKILESLRITQSALLTLCLFMAPVLYIQSMTAMDYVWALAFTLGAFYFSITGRIGLCGVFLGLAAASRPTAGLFILVIAAWMLTERTTEFRESWRKLFRISLISGSICIVFFLPLLFRFGSSLFRILGGGYPDLGRVAYFASVETFGLVGSLTLASAAVVLPFGLWRRIRTLGSSRRHAAALVASAVGVAIPAVLFFLMPNESGYLIAALPFLYLLIASCMRRWQAICIALLVASSSWVFSVHPIDRGLAIELAGSVLADHRERNRMVCTAQRLAAIAGTLKPGEFLVLDGWYPVVRHFTAPDKQRMLLYDFAALDGDHYVLSGDPGAAIAGRRLAGIRATPGDRFYAPEWLRADLRASREAPLAALPSADFADCDRSEPRDLIRIG